MLKKMVFGMMLTVLLISTLTLASNIQPVRAEWVSIHIRADGSIDPQDAPISTADNITYTLFNNVNGSIFVERSGIVINGNNSIIQGYVLNNVDNVTIENTVVMGGGGVVLDSSSHVVLSGNVIAQNGKGIDIQLSSNNNISGNIIALNDEDGILMENSSGNRISQNYIGGMATLQGLALCDYGIEATSCSNNTITQNNVTLCDRAIRFEGYSTYGEDASNNSITENTIQDFEWGLWIVGSSNNTIMRNNITSVGGRGMLSRSKGISIEDHSVFNIIAQNSIASHTEGVRIDESFFNSIIQNNATDNIYGLEIVSSAWNSIYQNHVANNTFGMLIDPYYQEYNNNTLKYNVMTGNTYNFGVESVFDGLDVDTTNTVDGKPIYYWVNTRDNQIPSDAGYVAIVNSTDIRVEGLDLRNNYQGILVANSNDITILHNNVTNNRYGIDFESSINNTISENDVTDNSYDGILFVDSRDNYVYGNRLMNPNTGITLEWSPNNSLFQNTISNSTTGISLDYSSDNNTILRNTMNFNYVNVWFVASSYNTIYHNYFSNYTQPAGLTSDCQGNIWDDGYSSGGNCWSDYNGTDLFSGVYQNDTGSDGIGDTPYAIDESNFDRYPLMQPYVSNLGDINRDGVVDISDAILAASAFGTYPGHSRWNSQADLNGDNTIDIFDVILLASNFGKNYNQHSWLGASGTDITFGITQVMGTNVNHGWLVEQVTSGGPADKAGVRGGTNQVQVNGTTVTIGGDIIVAINGTKIANMDDLSSYLEEYTLPGQTIIVSIVRNNQVLTLSLTLT